MGDGGSVPTDTGQQFVVCDDASSLCACLTAIVGHTLHSSEGVCVYAFHVTGRNSGAGEWGIITG